MKTIIIAAVLTACTVQAFAEIGTTDQKGRAMSVEQKKAEILQHIQKRIANIQAEMACVNSAQSHEDLRACREKYRPQRPRDDHEQRGSSYQHK